MAKVYMFWQVLEVYNRKIFRRDEILKEIARDAKNGKQPDTDLIVQLGEIENWLKDFEQAKVQTAFDIQF